MFETTNIPVHHVNNTRISSNNRNTIIKTSQNLSKKLKNNIKLETFSMFPNLRIRKEQKQERVSTSSQFRESGTATFENQPTHQQNEDKKREDQDYRGGRLHSHRTDRGSSQGAQGGRSGNLDTSPTSPSPHSPSSSTHTQLQKHP